MPIGKIQIQRSVIKNILEKIAEISTDTDLTSILQSNLIYDNDYFNIHFILFLQVRAYITIHKIEIKFVFIFP